MLGRAIRYQPTYLLLTALLAATVVDAASQTPGSKPSPTPVGVWLHANERIQVEIAPCSGRLCGRIVWFRWPNDAQGFPLVDLKNPDPALRTRPLLELIVLRGLRRTGENTRGDGEIYNPDDGIDYSARMSIQEDGRLRLRAYVLFPLFGRTQLWTRVH